MAEQKLLLATCCLLFLQISSTPPALPSPGKTSRRCIPRERDALLAFKAGLTDPGSYLASWEGEDCCHWRGVRCSNRTSHVVELRLHSLSEIDGVLPPGIGFPGGENETEMTSSLLALRHLRHLDLRSNDFRYAPIPEFIGGLNNLRHLDLSGARFGGRVPPSLGNLSKLLYLDLNSMSTLTASSDAQLHSSDLGWLSHLTALRYVDFSGANLSEATDWAHVVNKLPSLVTLNLRFCELQNVVPSPLHANLTSLENLDLYGNTFSSSLGAKNLFWYLPSLLHFDMGMSGLEGSIPEEVGNMTSIVRLDLSVNNLTGTIPATFKNLHNLEELSLLDSNINGPVDILLERLPGTSLRRLQLSENHLTGRLPDQLAHLSNLTDLDLYSNNLSGDIPLGIGELPKLTYLLLGSNSFDGAITEQHFAQLANLNYLDLSENSLAMVIQENWVPPFKLGAADLRSCKLGPKFPEWLRSQNSMYLLDISNASIAGSMPHWFWATFSRTQNMVLSSNQIIGMLPSTIFHEMEADTMDFSNNYFVGSIPKLPRKLSSLDLSRNNLSGPLPSDFGAPALNTLILFKNSLSGRIPSSFCNLRKLEFVDLSGNLLEGPFPNCRVQPRAGKSHSKHSSVLKLLKVLNLNSNNFSGAFPPLLQYCQKLIFLDLAYNQFYGNVPTWIGEKLLSLAFLSLRSNSFSGYIPQQLSNLKELQYLDLACNSMSGTIPASLVKLMAMTVSPDDDDSLSYVTRYGEGVNEVAVVTYTDSSLVVTKGQVLEYTSGIIYMVNMDFSCNFLTGQVPEGIGKLLALRSLNLSWNHLSGAIPYSIGGLHSLESLDLSHNGFSGEIPTSLSALTSLSRLNLSYNNLTGEIPSGSQLQTLGDQESIYVGNPGLCGPAVSRNCSKARLTPAAPEERQDDVSFFQGMGIGSVMGLWTVFCTLLFMRKWRVHLFSLYDGLYDRVYVQVAMRWPSMNKE